MKKLKIKLEEWNHTCADGCCYRCGVDIYINDEKIDSVEDDYVNTEVLEIILKKLGYDVEIILE